MKKQLETYFKTQDKFNEEFEEAKDQLSKIKMQYEKLSAQHSVTIADMKQEKERVVEKDKAIFELQLEVKKFQEKSQVSKMEEEVEKQQKKANEQSKMYLNQIQE